MSKKKKTYINLVGGSSTISRPKPKSKSRRGKTSISKSKTRGSARSSR